MSAVSATPIEQALIRKPRFRFLNLTWDDAVRYFFGGNAFIAIIVLGLITIFLFREGFGFFTQYHSSLELYRNAGLEYVDILKGQSKRFTELSRELNAIRLAELNRHLRSGKTLQQANVELAAFDEFAARVRRCGSGLFGLVSDLGEAAMAIKQKSDIRRDKLEEREMLERAGRTAQALAVVIPEVDFRAEVQVLRSMTSATYDEVAKAVAGDLREVVQALPPNPDASIAKRMQRFRQEALAFAETFPATREMLDRWDQDRPVPFVRATWMFLVGKEWLTASFWQDWYGILPLLSGSLLVSAIALALAVPFSVCAAIYVNQVAGVREQHFIKPAIEFIAAFPSVVLGFFGIVMLGDFLRSVSEIAWLQWLPGFPIQERLNATTAGILLGLMAVPTIFSLAEDAINNVPVAFKEASFALGASRLQTLVRIILPAALSGIVAAILLGFGRVIGETMVVLLCAGNRIAIPDFTNGVGAVFQPVHTMTGIIAQEMGEVPYGSIHYRALFMVAIVLFLLALVINYLAQRIVTRFRISIG